MDGKRFGCGIQYWSYGTVDDSYANLSLSTKRFVSYWTVAEAYKKKVKTTSPKHGRAVPTSTALTVTMNQAHENVVSPEHCAAVESMH